MGQLITFLTDWHLHIMRMKTDTYILSEWMADKRCVRTQFAVTYLLATPDQTTASSRIFTMILALSPTQVYHNFKRQAQWSPGQWLKTGDRIVTSEEFNSMENNYNTPLGELEMPSLPDNISRVVVHIPDYLDQWHMQVASQTCNTKYHILYVLLCTNTNEGPTLAAIGTNRSITAFADQQRKIVIHAREGIAELWAVSM